MIKNSKEADITKAIIANFNERLCSLSSINNPSETVEIEIISILSMIEDLKSQLKLYEDTVNNKILYTSVNSLNDLPIIIIGKRLQLGVSQRDFADMIGISEDNYLQLENNDFYNISPEILNIIISILGIQNNGIIFDNNSYDKIERNIKLLNIENDLLEQVIPISFKEISNAIKSKKNEALYLLEKFVESFKALFHLDLRTEITNKDLTESFAVAFKRRINMNVNNLTFVTTYAAQVSQIISKQLTFPSCKINADPIEIRSEIIKLYQNVSFDSCLEYIWSLNIGILPLSLKRGFHGACFDFVEKKVIVLNQQNKTVSRWKFDLLHELYHALTMVYNAYIEQNDIIYQLGDEETNASNFASFVIFGCEVDAYLELVLERSEAKVQFLKSSIVSVAAEYNLNIDDFSNYVAFRIRGQDINAWGTAANLQTDRRSPVDISRDFLLSKIGYNSINKEDMLILQTALSRKDEM